MYSLKEKVMGYVSAAIQYVKPIVNRPIVIGTTVATLIGGGSAMAAEKADNYGTNLIEGTAGQVCVIIPGKAVNHGIATLAAGYGGLKNGTNLPLVKKIPIVNNLFGCATNLLGQASLGTGYTALDGFENVVIKAPLGYKGSGPEELGEISEKLDESPLGRTAVAFGVGAGVGAIWAKSNGISAGHHHLVNAQKEVQGALAIGAMTGGSKAIDDLLEE